MQTRFYKRHQTGQIWHYYKVMDSRQPPARELLNFLSPTPMVDFAEYDLSKPSARIEYEAFGEVGIPITAAEYETAYGQATAGNFDLYLNGQLQ